MILCSWRISLRTAATADSKDAREASLSNSLAMVTCRSKSPDSDLVAPRASPRIALSTLASKALVNPPIADTTNTVRPWAARTMPAT